MNQKLTTCCPQCNARLVLPNRDYLGKQVSCPQCKTLFHAEVPLPAATPPVPAQADSPFAINTSASRSTTATVPSHSQRSSGGSSGRKRGLIIGACTAGIVLFAGLSWMLLKGSGSGAVAEDLAYMADDTDLFVRIRVAEILESPLLTKLLSENPAFQAIITTVDAQSGLSAKNIESVAIGLVGIARLVDSGGGVPSAGLPGSIVIHLREPVDVAELIRTFTVQQGIGSPPKKTSLDGKDYYKLSSPGDVGLGLCVINETTLVLGPSATVETVIKRGSSKAVDRFDFMDFNHQLLIGIAPLDTSFFDNVAEAAIQQGSPSVTRAAEIARGNITAVAWGCSVAGSVDGNALFQFTSPDVSTKFVPALKKGFVELNEKFSHLANVADGDQARAIDLLGRLLTNISVDREGTTARAGISISKTTIDLLIATTDGLEFPGPANMFSSSTTNEEMNGQPIELGGGNTRLILEGVTEEWLSQVVSMFEDSEFVLMEYLDRWLTSNVAPAVTIGATIDGEEATVVIIGIDDFSAFADKVDFGEVILVDKANNTVHVKWNGPNP